MRQATPAPIRVILADDHPVIRMGLGTIMEHSEFQVVGEASCPGELFSLLQDVECDVLVTDYLMPGDEMPDGHRMIERVRADWPTLPLVVLTMLRNPSLLRALWASRVNALVDKTTALQDIVPALRLAASGHTFLSANYGARLAEFSGGDALSGREADVLRMLVSGMSVSEIARKHGRSIKTISKQKMDAMRKLGLGTDMELHRYALDVGC
jgi:two-component system capsular synthesis response regulator RcsB